MSDKLRECPICGSKNGTMKYKDLADFVTISHLKTMSYEEINDALVIMNDKIVELKSIPKHETVEQWEARKLPDRSRKCIVWRYGEDPREMLFNHHGSWQVVGDYETFHCSHFTHWIYMPLSPNHHGKPEAT